MSVAVAERTRYGDEMTIKKSLRCLIVEDEPLITMVLTDILESMGHDVVASADTLAEAKTAVARGGFDVVILDVNLGHEEIWPVADGLADEGVPYVLATGSHPDDLPERHRGAMVLHKPYAQAAVEDLLAAYPK